jgi:hypothetical protein
MGEQKWYVFNDIMVYRGLETVARYLGPKEVLALSLGGKPQWEWMEGIATYWQKLIRGGNTPACTGAAVADAADADAVSAEAEAEVVGDCGVAGVGTAVRAGRRPMLAAAAIMTSR